jgi:Zn-dependent peptidase ImmA (M78 family)/DNA-binding XRE family transcriptional regulator
MAKKSLEVNISPAIIKWARESGGFSVKEVAKKLKTSKENYEKIETGKKNPTYRQLEILANCFKRPLAIFFLPEPPEEPSIAASFRILPKSEEYLSKELRLAIRKARYYQSIANELMKDLGIDIKLKIPSVSINDDPIIIAQKERERFEISIDKQLKWQNAYSAFNEWRSAVEQLNVLVFQYRFPLQSARGFSLMDKAPPVIVLNSSDNVLARIFTLFHEYGHILLESPEIYAEEEEISANNLEVETWCNRFSSEFLIPESVLRDDMDFQDFLKSQQLSNEIPKILKSLSKKFKVSRYAVLTKIRSLNLISQSDYESEKAKLKQESFPEKGKVFITPPQKCIHEKGKKFVSLVLQSKERGLITTADIVEYLSIKLKHLNKIEELTAR